MKASINCKTIIFMFFSLSTLSIVAITLSACSRSNSQAHNYESEYKELNFGVITETKFVTIGKPKRKRSSQGGATAAGAILGFIIGSGNNDVLGAVTGSLAGAAIGSLIDNNTDNNTIDYNYSTNNVNGQELLITLDNGKKISVVQRFQPGSSPFIPDDKVRIEQDIKRGMVLVTKVN